MPACPRCARPVAVSGSRCLYCGATLDEEPAHAPVPAEAPPAEPRRLLVVDQRGAPGAALAAALGLSPIEAARRSERGGLCLVRVAAPEAADEERRRLEAAGVQAWLLDEAAVRAAARPRLVRAGEHAGGALALQVDGAPLRVAPGDVALVVRGPIQREYQTTPGRPKIRAASLAEGFRVHLHLREGAPPLELDPGDFAFTDPAHASAPSLLVIAAWVDALQAPVDDEFKRMAPALGPAAATAGALALADALRPARRPDAPLMLDNLAQFRFYSAWRGLVEREKRR